MKITKLLQIGAIADEPLRGAIGALCVHWALLELSVERVIANLKGNPGIVTYSEDLGHRTDTLKRLAKASSALLAGESNTLCILASEIKKLCHERHRYVHGLWGLDIDGSLINIFPRAKDGAPARPATPAAIRLVKLRAFSLHKQLLTFVDSTRVVALPSRRKQNPKVPPAPSG